MMDIGSTNRMAVFGPLTEFSVSGLSAMPNMVQWMFIPWCLWKQSFLQLGPVCIIITSHSGVYTAYWYLMIVM